MSRPSPLLKPATLDPHSLVGLVAIALYELARRVDSSCFTILRTRI